MPPKSETKAKSLLPILLKGDKIKVHFKNLAQGTENTWTGTCVNVDPNAEGTVKVVFPNDMPGFPDGIPIPSTAPGIKTLKITVVKPTKSKEDLKSYQVPLPVASIVAVGAPVYVRDAITGDYVKIPEVDGARIREGYGNWVRVKGAPVEEVLQVGWVQVVVNYSTMHATTIKQHVKIGEV